MDEKVASRRWSRGSSVAARATCSSAFLFVMDRKMQVSARGDNIGAAYPRAIRNGEHVARRPTCTEGQSEYPEGDSDTTRALQDRRQLATVSVFWTFFLVPRRMPPSPGGGRRERGALASTTAEGTRDTRVDLDPKRFQALRRRAGGLHVAFHPAECRDVGRAMRCDYERRVRRRTLGGDVAEIQLVLRRRADCVTADAELESRGPDQEVLDVEADYVRDGARRLRGRLRACRVTAARM